MTKMGKPYDICWLDTVIADPEPYLGAPKELEAQFKGAPILHTFFPNAK
jgi:hypothetical protein